MPSSANPFEPPARWHVISDSDRTRTHLVDVLAFGGFGECSCEQFQYRLLPALQRAQGGERVSLSRCKHIEAAREAFTDFMISTLNQAVDRAVDISNAGQKRE